MKTIKTSIIAPILLALISLAACKKNSSTPTVVSSTSKLAFQMKAVNSASLALTTPIDTIAGLQWTAGTANISRFVFEAKRSGVSINIQTNNLMNVNIFSLSPTISFVTLDTGVYKEIEIQAFLEPTSDTAHIPLKLTGTFKNDSSKLIPVELDLNSDVTIKTEVNNFDITGTTNYVALVEMELEKLTVGVTAADLNGATLTGGKIIISKTSNSTIYWKIRSNLAECGHSEFKEHHHGDEGDGWGHEGDD